MSEPESGITKTTAAWCQYIANILHVQALRFHELSCWTYWPIGYRIAVRASAPNGLRSKMQGCPKREGSPPNSQRVSAHPKQSPLHSILRYVTRHTLSIHASCRTHHCTACGSHPSPYLSVPTSQQPQTVHTCTPLTGRSARTSH